MFGTNSHLVILESEQLLSKPIVVFALPFLRQELLDRISALEKLIPVSPNRIGCIRLSDSSGIFGVCRKAARRELSQKNEVGQREDLLTPEILSYLDLPRE